MNRPIATRRINGAIVAAHVNAPARKRQSDYPAPANDDFNPKRGTIRLFLLVTFVIVLALTFGAAVLPS